MNIVVMQMTARGLLGSKRAWLLATLPALMLLVAGLTRWGSGGDPATTAGLTSNFTLGTVIPLLCLLIGTGVIGPEIEDSSIAYLLAKPLPRRTIALSKLAVAYASAMLLGVVPVVLSTLLAGDQDAKLAASFGISAALASIAYVSIFFAMAIVSRNAVIIGLIYALLWETTLAAFVPGIQTVSVRQWAAAAAEKLLGGDGIQWGVFSAVSFTTGMVLIAASTVAAVLFAVRRLRKLKLRTAE